MYFVHWILKIFESVCSLSVQGSQRDLAYYIQGYTILSIVGVLLALIVAFMSRVAGLRAAAFLHKSMLNNIIQAPMR